MKRTTIRQWLLEGIIAIIMLIIPFFLLSLGEIILPAILSAWATIFILTRHARKSNPEVKEKTWFLLLEKFLYFQVINMAFAFALIAELMTILAFGLVITIVVAMLKTRNNPSVDLVKWSKYVALHVLNLIVLLFLISTTIEVEVEVLVFVLPIITFINGIQAAFFLKVAKKFKSGMHKILATIIILFMIISTAWQMFPN